MDQQIGMEPIGTAELTAVDGGMMNLPNRVNPMPPGWGSPGGGGVDWGKVKEIVTTGVAVIDFLAGRLAAAPWAK